MTAAASPNDHASDHVAHLVRDPIPPCIAIAIAIASARVDRLAIDRLRGIYRDLHRVFRGCPQLQAVPVRLDVNPVAKIVFHDPVKAVGMATEVGP